MNGQAKSLLTHGESEATRANPRLQRTWPSFSDSIAGISGVAFVNALPSPKAGHAAEREC
jgi:hypothetical protein